MTSVYQISNVILRNREIENLHGETLVLVVLKQKEINMQNSSMISVLANTHVYLTTFLNIDTGDSVGQSDTNVCGGSVYSQMGECPHW